MFNKIATLLQKTRWAYQCLGPRGVILLGLRRLIGARARCYLQTRKMLAGCVGLEIGGPSNIFSRKGLFPIYPIVHSLDQYNFANQTIWTSNKEATALESSDLIPPGECYIAEATDVSHIATGKYDYLLSSHMLEHTANPIRALLEWKRVVKQAGLLVIVVPHKDGTFDHHRPTTPLSHLIQDYENGTGEADLTHLQEVLALHDLKRDPGAGSIGEFRQRAESNFHNRALHHHVFDTASFGELLVFAGLRVVNLEPVLPFHIIGIAEKASEVGSREGGIPCHTPAQGVVVSPFPSDRLLVRSGSPGS